MWCNITTRSCEELEWKSEEQHHIGSCRSFIASESSREHVSFESDPHLFALFLTVVRGGVSEGLEILEEAQCHHKHMQNKRRKQKTRPLCSTGVVVAAVEQNVTRMCVDKLCTHVASG